MRNVNPGVVEEVWEVKGEEVLELVEVASSLYIQIIYLFISRHINYVVS